MRSMNTFIAYTSCPTLCLCWICCFHLPTPALFPIMVSFFFDSVMGQIKTLLMENNQAVLSGSISFSASRYSSGECLSSVVANFMLMFFLLPFVEIKFCQLAAVSLPSPSSQNRQFKHILLKSSKRMGILSLRFFLF